MNQQTIQNLVITTLMTAAGSVAVAQESGIECASLQHIASRAAPVVVDDVALDGSIAYMIGNDSTYAYDMSDPSNPTLLGSVSHSIDPRGVITGDGVALVYGYDGDGGVVEIIDTSAPNAMSVIGTLGPFVGRSVIDFDLESSTLAVGLQDESVQLYDLSSPGLPVLIGTYAAGGGNFWSVSLEGSRMYLALGAGGVAAVDISNPVAPVLLGTAPTDVASDVEASGDLVYVTELEEGLEIFDFTDPANPVQLGQYYLPDLFSYECGDLSVVGTRAYFRKSIYNDLGSYSYAVDVSDPSNPVKAGDFVHTVKPRSSAYSEDIAVFGLQYTTPGFSVFDVSTMYSVPYGEEIAEVGIIGENNMMYRFDRPNSTWRIQAFDITNPTAPVLHDSVSNLPLPGDVPLVVYGDFLLYADRSQGLTVFDARDPDSISAVQTFSLTGGGVDCIAVDGDTAYVTTTGTVMGVIDLSDPLHPVLLTEYDFAPTEPVAVHANDGKLFVSTRDHTIEILDASNPANPAPIGSVPIGSSSLQYNRFAVDSDSLYIAWDGIEIYDLSDLNNISQVGSYMTPNSSQTTGSLEVIGDRLYFTTVPVGKSNRLIRLPGFCILDVSDTSAPALLGGCNSAWGNDQFGPSFQIIDGVAYLIAGQHSTISVSLTEGCQPCVADFTGDGALDFFDVSAFLNAFSQGDLSADMDGSGSLDFFDVSGFLTAFNAGCP